MAESFGLSDKMNDAESNCLSCGAPLPAGREGQQKFTGGNMTLFVLGNDDKATQMLDNAKQAIKHHGLNVQVELVAGEEVIRQYGVRKLPALIINGSIVSQGIVCDTADIVDALEYMY